MTRPSHTKLSQTLFLFGNGISRRDFSIDSLKDKGLLVGFNWAYEEYPFDIICSADEEVSALIGKNWDGDWLRRDNYGNKRSLRDNVYWNTHDSQNLICKLPMLKSGLGWNTGRAAIYALNKKFQPKMIYLFGFDLGGLNIYVTRPSAYNKPSNYEDCWNFLFGQIPCTRVGPVDNMTEKLLCRHLTYEEFKNEV
jgi:hypothetical protein